MAAHRGLAAFALSLCAGLGVGAVAPTAAGATTATTGATTGATPTAAPSPAGFWLVDTAGRVGAVGTVPFGGAEPVGPSRAAVVALVPTPDDAGYWVVAADGGVFTYGDAHFYGSTGNLHLNQPIVTAAATPDGAGYWLVASDGGVFTFGDARFYGSTGSLRLNRPILSATATADGRGYWLIASDGGIFTFGDARFFGSTGSLHLDHPVVGAATTPDGAGYWMVTSGGRVFGFGDAALHGDLTIATVAPSLPVVGMAATPDGAGYWLATTTGSTFGFGDAVLGGTALPADAPSPVAGPVTTPDGTTLGPIVAVAAPGPPPAAGRAVQWALSQVGKPYVYGGVGPDGYDCSGLVMKAFASLGVTLPRVAQDQYGAGPLVPAGAPLEPGDVVFFGTPQAITHDGIYVGNGMMVDAPHTGALVRVEPYQWPDYVGATRPVAGRASS